MVSSIACTNMVVRYPLGDRSAMAMACLKYKPSPYFKLPPNKACTGRLGLCAFLGLVPEL